MEVTSNAPRKGLPPDVVENRMINRSNERWVTVLDRLRQDYLKNARDWATALQGQVAEVTGRLIAAQGAPVAREVVARAITKLTRDVVPQLRTARQEYDRVVVSRRQRVKIALQGFRTLLATAPQIPKAADEVITALHADAEKIVLEIAAPLIVDLCEHLLAPLRDAIAQAKDSLQIDTLGTAERPSAVNGWPTGPVPKGLEPPPNELVLVPVDGYPALFEDQLRAELNQPAFVNALGQARAAVITGEHDRDDGLAKLVVSQGRWVPRDRDLREGQTARPAQFDVRIGPDQLLERSRQWLRRPTSQTGLFLQTSLAGYLQPDQGTRTQANERLEVFRQALDQAVKLSRPLVSLNQPIDAEIHGSPTGFRQIVTPIPFPSGHPARAIVSRVFAGYNEAELGALYGDQPSERIDLFTFLEAPVQPMAMDSLVGPIRGQWAQVRSQGGADGFWSRRRARQLPWFVPSAPEVREAMVKGWFVARFLGYIPGCDPRAQPTRIYVPSEKAHVEFPFPLLGRIKTLRDWLPAVLESMAVTLISEPFEPYARLVDLGRNSAAELTAWVQDGKLPDGASDPDPDIAGSRDATPAERAKLLSETVRGYREEFEEHEPLRLDADTALDVSLAWKLRPDILDALGTLRG